MSRLARLFPRTHLSNSCSALLHHLIRRLHPGYNAMFNFYFLFSRLALVTATMDKTDTMDSLAGTGGTGKMEKMAQRYDVMTETAQSFSLYSRHYNLLKVSPSDGTHACLILIRVS